MVGFMGCYAAINALKLARHIVRSDPKAGVLMVNLELCTLHLQETQKLQQVLSFLVFADGAAASLITACEQGFALDSFKAVMVPETKGLITWKIRLWDSACCSPGRCRRRWAARYMMEAAGRAR